MAERVRLAAIADVPADEGLCVTAAGREIALFRWGDGFCAMDNECPHRGGPLADGPLQGDAVVCPWHGWAFRCSDGTSTVNPHNAVQVYPIFIEGDAIYTEF